MSAPHQALLMVGAGGLTLPTPIFFAPLLSSLTPTIAGGSSTATFTRATTAYATAVAPAGNAVDGQVLIQCASGEARFHGARRISSGNWSETYADGSAIPTANLLGYVAENAATNKCLQSQTFDNATWVKSNATVTADTTAAQDGTTTADTIAATSALGLVSQTISVTAVVHAFSVYLKRLAGTGTVELLFDGAATDVTAQINSSTWSRVVATGTPAAGSKVFSIRISTSGDSVYAWGAQLETVGPTSYIPTTTATVNRNQDVLTYVPSSNFSAATGSIYAESYFPWLLIANNPAVLHFVTSGTYPLFYKAGTGQQLRTFSSAEVVTANVRTVGSHKQAAAWGSSTGSVCLNGGTVGTGSMTSWSIGSSMAVGGSDFTRGLNGCVRNLKTWNVRHTDAELVTLTT